MSSSLGAKRNLTKKKRSLIKLSKLDRPDINEKIEKSNALNKRKGRLRD
jgi:hypothetical protein